MIDRNSSQWLLKTRKMMNYTRKELAEKSGLTYICIEQLENGKRNGKKSTWSTLHSVLPDVDYDDDGIPVSRKD